MEEAFILDDRNTLTLKYLANHYFLRRDYTLSQKFCEHGLEILESSKRPESAVREDPNFRKELEFLKSDFFFIQGKIQHA